MKLYLKEILHLLGSERKRLPGLFSFFLIISVFDVAGLGLIGPYIAVVADPGMAQEAAASLPNWLQLPADDPYALLMLMSGALLMVFTLKTIGVIWVNYLIVRFSVDQQVRLRTHLMQSYQSLPYVDYLKRNSSEYIHSMEVLVGSFTNSVLISGMKSIGDSVVALAILAFLAWANPMAFAVLAALLAVAILGYDRLFRRKMKESGTTANESATSMVKSISEGIEGLKEIRIIGREEHFKGQVETAAKRFAKAYARASMVNTAPRYLFEWIMVVFVVVMVVIATSGVEATGALLPMLGMFGMAAIRLVPAANMVAGGLLKLRFLRDSVSRLYKDVQTLDAMVASPHEFGVAQGGSFDHLELDGVRFQYEGAERAAIDDIKLTIKAGESVGFIGTSGSGKTTLIDTILGLLDPQEGAVSFNGRRVSDDKRAWRRHVAYLPQQVFVIDDTIRRNIALGVSDAEIDELKVLDALEKAKLIDLIKELPEGADTVLGERGVRLSGGQRQRIALARAFYHERDVLVMDEATSALDNETEKEIVEEIRQLKGVKTLIVIAHRLTTVRHCDRIYRIEKGRITASGTPDEMLGAAG